MELISVSMFVLSIALSCQVLQFVMFIVRYYLSPIYLTTILYPVIGNDGSHSRDTGIHVHVHVCTWCAVSCVLQSYTIAKNLTPQAPS